MSTAQHHEDLRVVPGPVFACRLQAQSKHSAGTGGEYPRPVADFSLAIPWCPQINEQRGGRFASPSNIPTICEALHKAALDPRIDGIYFKVAPKILNPTGFPGECIPSRSSAGCRKCVPAAVQYLHRSHWSEINTLSDQDTINSRFGQTAIHTQSPDDSRSLLV